MFATLRVLRSPHAPPPAAAPHGARANGLRALGTLFLGVYVAGLPFEPLAFDDCGPGPRHVMLDMTGCRPDLEDA
ncbi:hypothetical protein GCM10007967_21220 [Xylanimonas ulmi]